MGAPPPGEFTSSTTMVVRGAAKYPDDLRRFHDELDRILRRNNGLDGMLASRTGFQIRVTNQNAGPSQAFDDRFKEMRRELETALGAFPNLETYLSLIKTSSTRIRKKKPPKKMAKARKTKTRGKK
jgi:hypothetical protein